MTLIAICKIFQNHLVIQIQKDILWENIKGLSTELYTTYFHKKLSEYFVYLIQKWKSVLWLHDIFGIIFCIQNTLCTQDHLIILSIENININYDNSHVKILSLWQNIDSVVYGGAI